MLNVNLLNISDGRTPIAPPFTQDMILPKLPITDLLALGKCVGSAQAVLDSFLHLTPPEIPSVPGVVIPKMVHAFLIMFVATLAILGSSGLASTAPNEQRSKDIESLKVEQYLDRALEVFRKSPSPENGRSRKVMKVLALLRKWYARIIMDSYGLSEPSISPTAVDREDGRFPNELGIESRNMTNITMLPASLGTHPENPFPGNPTQETQQPNLSNVDTILESGELFTLRDDQFAYFTSLIEQPGGPPWTLFDDAMGVFDFI